MSEKEFGKLFPEGIVPGRTLPFVHKGKWAIHGLLPFLLSYTGDADVYVATFNVSEDSLRTFFFLQEGKSIRSLTMILDTTVKRHKLDMLLFAANVTPDIHIASNHMKVMLVENGSRFVGVVGSANMNNNPRYEAGFIFTDEQYYRYFKDAFMNVYRTDSVAFEWN
ncbi:MAG: hypothetical protein LBC40_05930 [Dysgonamonadaceae bacterium]|jgi:hypothetical protein|nr:hypothetical protein [Dysgonamonadaceae bacterium]